MSLSIPTKMSLFENVTSLSTASYIIGLDVYGGALSNIKISGSAAGYELARKRWIIDPPVTSTSDSRGDDGAESYSNDGKYWIKSGSVWIEISGGGGGGSGTAGTSGQNGQNGSSGTSGQNGQNGSSGTSGQSGIGGSSGTSGQNGQNGSSGTSGQSGQAGPTTGAIYSRLMKNISGTISNYSSETKWANADVFNVKDFGAVGDGSTDDSSAIQNAINAATATVSGGCIYFPAGKYKINSTVTATTSVDISFKGDGDVSEIRVNTATCFDINLASKKTVHILNLKVIQLINNCTAFDIAGPMEGNYHATTMLFMDGVTIGSSEEAGYFRKGVTLYYVYNAVITNCMFNGRTPTISGTRANYDSKAIEITGLCTNINISNSEFNFWTYGFKADTYQEGTLFDSCVMIDVRYGIYSSVASSALRNTLLHVCNTHIDSRDGSDYAIYTNNQDGLLVSNSYLISSNVCVQAIQTFQSSLTGNYFFMAGTHGIKLLDSNPIVYDDASNIASCIAVTITGNVFMGSATTVYLDNNCMSCIVQNNVRGDRSSTPPAYRPNMIVYSFNATDTTGGTRGNVVQS
jgi:hypothetical protein